ncbi:hypothetical protein ACP2XS_11810 [Staphylococcus epidermidis]|jgi:hypothetical protein|uniref:hypothetical protein n=1 Tax=Staphylococcus TaxID=1279 RepID=UPI0006B5CD7C|nr:MULTISPECIES: hypothetical protein [Staphylococcus]MCI2772995.1 hypothetical protein [Staphylococcus warneri]MCI2785371.1 hypothetical protein [Staphylococcus warneri]MCI2956039.1 hypothetical protein [Staphylococcus caprae]MDR8589350.1 hypothetical protein [Staphylococcus aureus]NMV36201.1 hypothetical protein [Staphylococcus aureus]
MFGRMKEFFDRARSDKLIGLLKEHESEFNFNVGTYFFPAVVISTIGCLFFQQAFWFACFSIGLLSFITLLKQIHDFEDKNAYEEFLDICVRKEGVVFSIITIIGYSIMSIISMFLLKNMANIQGYGRKIFNYEPTTVSKIFDGIILLIFYPIGLGLTIAITSMAISSVARLVVPLVIKKSRKNNY